MKALIALAILTAAQPLLADSNLPPAYWANRQLPDPDEEAKAQALMGELRCLVCQGQSIADSDAELPDAPRQIRTDGRGGFIKHRAHRPILRDEFNIGIAGYRLELGYRNGK